MTTKKVSRRSRPASPKSQGQNRTVSTPPTMVRATESAWSGASLLGQSKSAGLSRQRMIDARGDLLRSEREFISLSVETEGSMGREADELERKAAQIRAESWAIEQQTQTQVMVLKAQARMETELAKHIKDIAERSALSVLDRIKEASDSLMDWAGLIGNDLSDMLKKEAAEQIERQVADMRAIDEAVDEEERAVELLELTARYKNELAA